MGGSFDSSFDSSFDIDGVTGVPDPVGWVQVLAFSRMPIQFRDKPTIMGILSCVLPSVQALEDTIANVAASRNVNTATGISLTNLGRLVGQPRVATIDDDFRRYVRAKIAVNRSHGVFEDIIKIALLVLDSTFSGHVAIANEGTATARMQLTGAAVSDTTASILNTLEQAAVAIGVRLVVEYSPLTPSTVFTLDTGPGLDSGHLATALG